MIKLLEGLLRYYDVDIMDSLSYFAHNSAECFIGRGNSSIDSDNSGDCSKESKESVLNDSDDGWDGDIPIILVPGDDGSNRGDSDKGSDNGGSSENICNIGENVVVKSKKDSVYIRTYISYLFKFISKYTIQHISQTINNIIPTILTWGWDGGGGDTSPGITYLGSVLKSVISKGLKLYSYIDYIPSGLLYTVIGYFLMFKLLYRLYRFLYWELKTYEIDMRWMLPSFTSYRVPYETVNPLHRLMRLHRLKAWTLPPHFTDWVWVFSFNNYYGIYHLKQIRRALGLHFIRGNAITTSFHSISFADRGLRTLILRDFVASTVRVSTRILDPISCEYIYHYFYILIYMGVGAVVWYQTLPAGEGLITPCPTGFDFDIAPEFRDPTLIAPGYRKLCYLFTKDLTPTVINSFTNHVEFTDILSDLVEVDLSPTGVEGGQQCVIAVGTALMIAVLLTTKSLVIPA